MRQQLLSAILPGLAYGAALAVAAMWSLRAQTARPHLGVAAVAAVGAATSARLTVLPLWGAAAVAAATTGVFAAATWHLESRVRNAAATVAAPPAVADLTVLAAAVALAGVLVSQPLLPVLGWPPLGGVPSTATALAAVGIAGGAVALLGRLDGFSLWVVAGTAGALVAIMAASSSADPLAGAGPGPAVLWQQPVDVAGFAIRVAAIAAAACATARWLPPVAVAGGAALILGLGEWLLAATGRRMLIVLPLVVVVAVAAYASRRGDLLAGAR